MKKYLFLVSMIVLFLISIACSFFNPPRPILNNNADDLSNSEYNKIKDQINSEPETL